MFCYNCGKELPDGSVVAPKEAIKWLKKQQEGENNE